MSDETPDAATVSRIIELHAAVLDADRELRRLKEATAETRKARNSAAVLLSRFLGGLAEKHPLFDAPAARSLPPEKDEDDDDHAGDVDLDATLAEACERAEARKGINEAFAPAGIDAQVAAVKAHAEAELGPIEWADEPPAPNLASEQTGAGLGPFPKLAGDLARGKAGRKPKAAPEPAADDSEVFVIRSKSKGTLSGFVEAPSLSAAKAYTAEVMGGAFRVELDLDGLVTRSKGYSVPSVDASGKLATAVAPPKPKAARPAAKVKPRKAQGVRP